MPNPVTPLCNLVIDGNKISDVVFPDGGSKNKTPNKLVAKTVSLVLSVLLLLVSLNKHLLVFVVYVVSVGFLLPTNTQVYLRPHLRDNQNKRMCRWGKQ